MHPRLIGLLVLVCLASSCSNLCSWCESTSSLFPYCYQCVNNAIPYNTYSCKCSSGYKQIDYNQECVVDNTLGVGMVMIIMASAFAGLVLITIVLVYCVTKRDKQLSQKQQQENSTNTSSPLLPPVMSEGTGQPGIYKPNEQWRNNENQGFNGGFNPNPNYNNMYNDNKDPLPYAPE